jgi:hypothetical protein
MDKQHIFNYLNYAFMTKYCFIINLILEIIHVNELKIYQLCGLRRRETRDIYFVVVDENLEYPIARNKKFLLYNKFL